MLGVELIAIGKALKILDAMKAQYKIMLPDGTEFGTLEVLKKSIHKDKPTTQRDPPGTHTRWCYPILDKMAIGDVAVVSPDMTGIEGIDLSKIQRVLSGAAHSKWGPESHACRLDRTLNVVELMRML